MNPKPKTQIKEDKLKPLQPTLREKKRFIKIKIENSQKIEFKELSNQLLREITYYLGAIDIGKAGIWILKDKFNHEKQELIIKVNVKYKDKLVGALALTNINNAKINIIRVSGTLKGVEKEQK